MKVQLRTGNNPIKLQGQSFGRAYLLVSGVGDNPIKPTDFQLQNLRSTITVKQAGVEGTTSFNAVGPTVKGALDSNNPDYLKSLNIDGTTGTACAGVYIQGSGDLQTTFFIPLLEGGYILRGDDCIDMNIEVLPEFFQPNVRNNSYVYLVTEEENGITQTDINLPRYEPIDNSRQQVAFSYDGISELYFINSNLANYTVVYDPLTAIELRSAYVNDRFDNGTLQSLRLKRTNQLVSQGNYKLYSVEPNALYDVQVNASINVQGVLQGTAFVYVNTVLTGRNLLARGIAQATKIQKRNLQKRGL